MFQQLSTAYAEPSRAYHNIEHIRACLAEFDECRELARHPEEVEAALWFHDAVYVPGAADNEEQSARLAESALRSHGVAAEVTQRIGDLVRATQHVTLLQEPDAQLLCDIDLAILGREPAVFDRFESQIRREYGWVPESLYRRSRSAILARLLGRASIYQTRRFTERYEGPARRNLKRMLTTLSS
jgi:predicted metal-dependent HD superfamily phosphohydrolase